MRRHPPSLVPAVSPAWQRLSCTRGVTGGTQFTRKFNGAFIDHRLFSSVGVIVAVLEHRCWCEHELYQTTQFGSKIAPQFTQANSTLFEMDGMFECWLLHGACRRSRTACLTRVPTVAAVPTSTPLHDATGATKMIHEQVLHFLESCLRSGC